MARPHHRARCGPDHFLKPVDQPLHTEQSDPGPAQQKSPQPAGPRTVMVVFVDGATVPAIEKFVLIKLSFEAAGSQRAQLLFVQKKGVIVQFEIVSVSVANFAFDLLGYLRGARSIFVVFSRT